MIRSREVILLKYSAMIRSRDVFFSKKKSTMIRSPDINYRDDSLSRCFFFLFKKNQKSAMIRSRDANYRDDSLSRCFFFLFKIPQ